MSVKVTVSYQVGSGAEIGSHAKLCGNSGSGDIDYDNPIDRTKRYLFPGVAGIFGFGRAAFGHCRFGKSVAIGVPGFGCQPFGLVPFGYGTVTLSAIDIIAGGCSTRKYAFALYDSLGNINTGSPDEDTIEIHSAPDEPTRLTKTSYSPSTDILVLGAA